MSLTEKHKGPLHGLNVIDFGWYYAGPMAGMLLADQGANVIRIVKPGAKELPEQQYRLLNRNKKLLELDLKTEGGKAQALSLIEKADVLIENFRPGVMKRLGLDYASVKESNPGLVYLSLPGFASTDKERRYIQAWEGILGAASGMFHNLSHVRLPLGFPPLYTSVPQCSSYGALHGALAVMAALVKRNSTCRGTCIEVVLSETGLTAFAGGIIFEGSYDGRGKSGLPPSFNPFLYKADHSNAENAEKLKSALSMMKSLTSRTFECADGRELLVFILQSNAWQFLEALGIENEVRREGFVNEGMWENCVDTNITALLSPLSPERRLRLHKMIAEALKQKPAIEWERLLGACGASAVLVRTRQEWLSLDDMHQSEVFVDQGADDSKMTVPGRLVDVSDSNGNLPAHVAADPENIDINYALTLFAAPESNLQGTPSSQELMPTGKGSLLKGLKVLDLSNMVAGPAVSHHLAEYGADVITAAPPRSEHFPPYLMPQSQLLQMGKRSIVWDIRTADGREIFAELVRWADVVIHNVLDDKAERLGVTHAQLKALNPEVVSCQVSAYGGAVRGGWECRPGVEPTAQAVSGIMTHYGSLESPQDHGFVACTDIPAGMGGGFATLLGVYQKLRNGQAGECRTSLVRSSNFVQLPWMISQQGKCDWGEARGQFAKGEHPWQRLYECSNGWVYVGTSKKNAPALYQCVTDSSEPDAAALEAKFIEEPCSYWLKVLEQHGIACHIVTSIEDIYAKAPVTEVDNTASENVATGASEVLRWNDHPCGRPVTLFANDYVRIGENHSWWLMAPAPRIGEHTREILSDLGYSTDQIEHWIELGVAHAFLPVLKSEKAYLTVADE